MRYPLDLVRVIATKHKLKGEPELLPATGMVNEVWRIGDAILRITHQKDCDEEAAREAYLLPLLQEHSISTPELLSADTSCALAPRPYTIYRKASGVLLGTSTFEPSSLDRCYFELGVQIARIQSLAIPKAKRKLLRESEPSKPVESLEKSVAAGAISFEDAAEMREWFSFLEPKIQGEVKEVFCHRDLHPWNLFVNPESGALGEIIDWGDAGYADPAYEFASMPLVAMPHMLAGYGLDLDEGFVARALWSGMGLALWEVRGNHMDGYDRPWWRMPPGGWPEMKEFLRREFPDLMP